MEAEIIPFPGHYKPHPAPPRAYAPGAELVAFTRHGADGWRVLTLAITKPRQMEVG